VQDITDLAGVNRATFYDHYTDKFALLEAMVGCRFHQLLSECHVQFDGTCGSALKAMVLAAAEYLTRLEGPGGMRQVEPHMESAMIAVIRRILIEGLKKRPVNNGIAVELVATTASWAIYGAVKEWAHTPSRCPDDEFAATVMTMLSPILQLPFGKTEELL
jgi:AcrR family transcriptional regulator